MRDTSQFVLSIVDSTGAQREVPRPVRRIVSLVPSVTETLLELGLDEEIVGITRFCIHPKEKVRDKERVGGPRDPDLAKIVKLKPDLILMNREENRLEDLCYLEKRAPVFVAYPRSPEEAAEGIEILGLLTGREEKARNLSKLIRDEIAASKAWVAKRPTRRVVYLVWRRPYIVTGADTYASAMLALHGLVNVAPGDGSRYPRVTSREIVACSPDLILLPTEPYRFRQPHAGELARVLALAGSSEGWTEPASGGGEAGGAEAALSFPPWDADREKEKETEGAREKEKQKQREAAGGAQTPGASPAIPHGSVLPLEAANKGAVEKAADCGRPEDLEAIARWETKIRFLDGTYPVWHGFRMLAAMPYLRRFVEELTAEPQPKREAQGATG